MEIQTFYWDEINIAHIARHNIVPEEIENVAFDDDPYIRKYSNLRYLYGQTVGGRYLFVVYVLRSKAVAYVVTSRNMDEREQKLYNKNRK